MKFDDFLRSIGDWGIYQKKKYFILCLSYMLPSIMVYQYSFTAAKPKFRCENPLVSTKDNYEEPLNNMFHRSFLPSAQECQSYMSKLSLQECQQCYRTEFLNDSSLKLVQCENFVFDRSIYQETLTEQVWTLSFFL